MKLPEKWRRVPIKEVYVGLYDGPHATPKPSDEGPVFLGIGNVTEDGHLDYGKVRHISEEEYPKWTKRVTPQQGDIVFTYEATLNRYAIIPKGFRGCLGRRMALIRPNTEIIDTRFLHYYFFGKDWRDTIEANRLAGATVDRVPLTHFPEFPISLPPLRMQQRIASILSSYDDLIENNTRRIEILKEMAQRLYEEWFVHFHFPGHEEVNFKDSELGRIPEEWVASPAKEAYEGLFDGPHATPKTSDVGPVFLGIKNLREEGGLNLSAIRHISEEEYPKWTKRVTPVEGDIVFTYEATLNRYALIPKGFVGCLGRRLALIRPMKEYRHFLYLHFFSESWRYVISKNILSGATVDRIPLTKLPDFPLPLPPVKIASDFGRLVEPLFQLTETLVKKNANLRAQRDLLLPKLVSGEIDVSEILMPNDKEVEAA